jgi:hypothetical protein
MMVLPATFSKSNSFGESVSWMHTTTLGKEYALQEKSLQFVERPTGSTCTYGITASMLTNPTVARHFILFKYLPSDNEHLPDAGDLSDVSTLYASCLNFSCLEAVKKSFISSRCVFSDQLCESLRYPEVQAESSTSDLLESSWESTYVIQQEEEELGPIRADTDRAFSFNELLYALDRISRPMEIENIPLSVDPDDFPIV